MNRIILQFSQDNQYTFPINEDFSIEAVSEFGTFGDLCPVISQLVDLGNIYYSTGGVANRTGVSLRTILDAPRWTKTNPVKITIDIFFYTIKSALKDVVEPLNFILGTHILNKDSTGAIRIPGINSKNVINIDKIIDELSDRKVEQTKILEAQQALNKYTQSQHNSICSVLIPGVVFLEAAYVMAVIPTYSKHTTEEGYPLWASANVQLQGITPAFEEQFQMGKKFSGGIIPTVIETGTSHIEIF